jgi:hypothetical protein
MTDGDEEYIFVYNNGGSTINVGHGCIVSGVTGYSVTVSSVTSVDFLIGVCKHTAIPSTNYGWLVTRGFTSVEMGADYSGVTGALLTLGTDGTFDIVSNTTGNKDNTVGKLVASVASGASASAYICA